ncbi:MAG: DHA2 family efflux MFS transporter permease subunit, partial [Acetobacter sp.]|nr:DHA2 family efflux MFS transporter permease subunit [Acetobacter sp.]
MSGAPAKDGVDWTPGHNPWLIAFAVTLVAFMEILDTTIVNVSLPHIAGSLSSTYDDATWTLTSYLVANGIVLTISGWLGRVLGRKRYFLICIIMFTVSSFLCGTATSLGELIFFRLMQGFFGGGLQPNQQSIILDTFPPEKRAAAFGMTAIAAVVGPVLGPTLGGWITDNFSWRWIFFINVPFGILTTFAVMWLVNDPPWAKKQSLPVDVIGISLITIGFGCLEVAVDRGEDADWFGSTFICIMAACAVIGIVSAVIWLLKAKKPAVDLRVFKDRNFAVGTLLIGIMGALLYSSAIIVPQFAQQQMGYTAMLAGLVLSPGGIAVIILIPIVGR